MPDMAKANLQGFWAEIRRRHVPRVAAYYVAGAWVAAQVASLLFDAFDAHHYTRYVIGALAGGLPVALALAWRFDLTARGLERTLSIASPPPPVVALPAAAIPERSIAVLPFANLSQDPDNEYFSDGLSEEIRNQLARCTDLRVVARSSSFAFKGRHEDVREIGRRLSVAKVLEGGVRRHAGTVRIDVQLVNAADGYHLWSQTYERKLGDIFSLQSEIAAAVAAAVGERPAAAPPAPRPPETRNFAAYNAYLLGRHYFHKRTEATLQRAIECFEQAIAADPDYALAYSGLADACILVSAQHYGNVPLAQAIERALPAAQRALALEPGLAEAHASHGMVLLHQGALARAEQAFRHALELNPGYTMAHIWLGLAMTALGRYREAANSNLEAFRLDPLSPIVNSNVAFDALRFDDTVEARTRFTYRHGGRSGVPGAVRRHGTSRVRARTAARGLALDRRRDRARADPRLLPGGQGATAAAARTTRRGGRKHRGRAQHGQIGHLRLRPRHRDTNRPGRSRGTLAHRRGRPEQQLHLGAACAGADRAGAVRCGACGLRRRRSRRREGDQHDPARRLVLEAAAHRQSCAPDAAGRCRHAGANCSSASSPRPIVRALAVC